MLPTRQRALVKFMWASDVVLMLVLLVSSVVVDMNGEYPFLPSCASGPFTLSLLGAGIAVSVCLMAMDERRRFLGGVFLLLFVLAAVPLLR